MSKSDEVIISDHALIRYIERYLDVDLNPVRQQIRDKTQKAIEAGAMSIQIDGFLFTIAPQQRTVVTILTPEQRRNQYAGTRGKHLLKTGAFGGRT